MTSLTLAKLSNGGKGLPCCGLASLSLITNTPLPIIYMHYRARYNKPKQWRGATSTSHVLDMMKLYQVQYELVNRRDMPQGRTLENFIKDNPGFYGLVHTDRHLQVVLGSQVYDQGGAKDISIHFGKNKYIQSYARVTGSNNESMDYRYLMLVSDGVVNTMQEAKELYNHYMKEALT